MEGAMRPTDSLKPMTSHVDRGSLAGGLIALILFAAFATLVILRTHSPLSSTLQDAVSLRHMAPDFREQIEQVLVIPVAALVVVFFRLALGLRMLGPFRPILIAAAFQSVGVFAGLIFMVVVLGVTLLLRPPLKAGLRPYYVRLAAMLCVVVLLEITAAFSSSIIKWAWLGQAVFFPIVVLTLTTDSFARVLANDGPAQAMWRGGTTLTAALVSSALVAVDPIRSLMVDYPETLLLIIALIVVVSNYLNYRFLAAWNPSVRSEV
jgi:hypothetical protein